MGDENYRPDAPEASDAKIPSRPPTMPEIGSSSDSEATTKRRPSLNEETRPHESFDNLGKEPPQNTEDTVITSIPGLAGENGITIVTHKDEIEKNLKRYEEILNNKNKIKQSPEFPDRRNPNSPKARVGAALREYISQKNNPDYQGVSMSDVAIIEIFKIVQENISAHSGNPEDTMPMPRYMDNKSALQQSLSEALDSSQLSIEDKFDLSSLLLKQLRDE